MMTLASCVRCALLFAILLLPIVDTANAQAQDPPLSQQERLELEAYRTYVPQLAKALDEARRHSVSDTPEIAAYRKYLSRYYEQSSQLRDVRVQMFSWQGMASTWVLVLVVVLTLGGLTLAGYQLYVAARLGQKMESTGFEASAQRVQVTTSTVGIVILIISGIYLLLFLKEVYPVQPGSPTSAGTQQQETTP